MQRLLRHVSFVPKAELARSIDASQSADNPDIRTLAVNNWSLEELACSTGFAKR